MVSLKIVDLDSRSSGKPTCRSIDVLDDLVRKWFVGNQTEIPAILVCIYLLFAIAPNSSLDVETYATCVVSTVSVQTQRPINMT